MEVGVDPLEQPSLVTEVKTITLTLPRAPTANELKQKFLAYRVSDTSYKYYCLVCDKMYTSRYGLHFIYLSTVV